MDIKDMKKLILVAICIFMLGFGCLIIYYVDYAEKTKERESMGYVEDVILNQQDVINNMQSESKNPGTTKFGETDSTYNYEEFDMDKYSIYAEDQLNFNTNATEEETTKIYNEAMQKIRYKILSRDTAGAAAIANDVMSKHVFKNGSQFAGLTNIKSINGFELFSGSEQSFAIQTIPDPVSYVGLFYMMSPEYQAFVLGDDNFLFVPANENNQITLMGVEKAGPLESRASEYFSDLENISIDKVKIKVAEMEYDVYVIGKTGYSYRISNIEFSNKSITSYSNYTDYFNVWGRDEIEYNFD